jgi:hypothetical protein
VAELVAYSKVIHGAGAAFLRRLFEPLCSLVVVVELVIEDCAQSVHRKDVSFSLRFIVLSDGELDALFDSQAFLVELSLLIKSLATAFFVLSCLPVERESPG